MYSEPALFHETLLSTITNPPLPAWLEASTDFEVRTLWDDSLGTSVNHSEGDPSAPCRSREEGGDFFVNATEAGANRSWKDQTCSVPHCEGSKPPIRKGVPWKIIWDHLPHWEPTEEILSVSIPWKVSPRGCNTSLTAASLGNCTRDRCHIQIQLSYLKKSRTKR